MKTPFWNRTHLWDRTLPNSAAAASATQSDDIWAIELNMTSSLPPDVVLLEDLGYEVESSRVIHRSTVYHLVKE